jgi:hypothetical protein
MTEPTASRLTTKEKLRRTAFVLFVLACLLGIGWGASQVREVDENGDVIAAEQDAAGVEITGDEELRPGPDDQPADIPSEEELVEQTIPSEGAEILQQQQIGIDLGGVYRVEAFYVDGLLLEEEDLIRREELNQVFFQPGDDTPFDVLPEGRVCARADVARIENRADVIRSVEWCFEVT